MAAIFRGKPSRRHSAGPTLLSYHAQAELGTHHLYLQRSSRGDAPDMIHYGVNKTGQLVVSRGLAEMTKGTNVTVNAILPGPTRSEGVVGFLQGLASTPNATPEQAEKEFFEKHRPTSLIQRM